MQALRNLLNLAPLPVLLLASVMVHAQDSRITVEVINGKNGKPVKGARLLIFGGETPQEVQEHAKGSMELVTDANGIAFLAASSLKFSWIQVFVDTMTLCQHEPNLKSFSVNEITSAGLQTPNTCSSAVRKNTPGKFIVFARQPSFRERMGW